MYFITFIEDCFNFSYAYLMINKSEAINMFKIFLLEIKNQFGKKNKRLRSDIGTEYDSVDFKSLYASLSIIHDTIPPYSPEKLK